MPPLNLEHVTAHKLRALLGGPQLIVVAGLPGCGKSTVARQLQRSLGHTVIDKDRTFRESENSQMLSLGGEPWDRDSDLYRSQVYPETLARMGRLARTSRELGGSLILDAPFLSQAREALAWNVQYADALEGALGIRPDLIFWVGGSARWQEQNMRTRGAERDRTKLRDFAAYRQTLSPLTEDGIFLRDPSVRLIQWDGDLTLKTD